MKNPISFKVLLFTAAIFLVLGFNREAPAQEIILKDLNGKPVQISSYKGKPAILFFWTTWCPYCRKEIKKINQQYPQISQEGITVFGVNVSESDYKVQRFFQGYPLNFMILLDKEGLLADQYNLLGVPTYVFLDKNGKVVTKTNNLPDNYKTLLFK